MRHSWPMWLMLAGAAVPGCSSLPDLRFADDVDAASLDAASDASQPDLASDSGGACGKVALADVCCGERLCRGDCTATQCAKCEVNCGATEICCAKNNAVLCRAKSSPGCN